MHLLFDAERTFLGTVYTRRGQLDHVQLTPSGEHALGARIEHWRTRGISQRTWIERPQADGSTERLCIADYCAVHDERFEQAIEPWAEEYGVCAIKLAEDRVAYWEGLCALPLDPAERFVLLLAMRQADKDELFVWKEALAEAQTVAGQERSHHAHILTAFKEKLHSVIVQTFAK